MTAARIPFLGALGASVAVLVWTHPATAEDGSTNPPSAPTPWTHPAPVAPPPAQDSAPPPYDPPSAAESPSAPTTAPAPDPAPAPAPAAPAPAAPAPAAPAPVMAESPTVPKPAPTVTPAVTTSRKTEAPALEVKRTEEPNSAVGAGILIFSLSYLPATMFAQSSTAHVDEMLYVPLAGPWLDLARRPTCGGNACNTEFGNRALLVTDGMLQDFGFLLTLAGLLSNEAVASTQTAKVVETPARKVRVSPAEFGAGAYGIAAFGKF